MEVKKPFEKQIVAIDELIPRAGFFGLLKS
jgi:hypothetical protein